MGDKPKKCVHCREVINIFMQHNPTITSISFVEEEIDGKIQKNGKIAFTIFMSDIGFERETFVKYGNELFSNYLINFFGEFLVRENISEFIELIKQLDRNKHIEEIVRRTHVNFGICVEGNTITFDFHISLLSKILTEDVKKILQYSIK